MADINFSIRGTKDFQRVYFRYRPSRNFDILLKTPFEINKDNWDCENQNWNISQIVKGAKTEDSKIGNLKIQTFNKNLAEFRGAVSDFIDTQRDTTGERLKKAVADFVTQRYFPHKVEDTNTARKPAKMDDLITFYIEYRSVEDKTNGTKPLAENTVKKYKTLQKVLREYQKDLKVTDISDVWRANFVQYLNKLEYAPSTQVKFVKDVRMLCEFAEDEHEINRKVLKWKVNPDPESVGKGLYFSFDQLQTLKTTVMPTESLDNVRDWLLISCYTSVRVSELLIFDEKNIIEDNGNKFIMVQESKNRNHKDKGMKCIYLLPEVVKILEKRGGKFPRKISEQKYNEYLKDVCEEAKFTEIVKGAIRTKNKDGKVRKVVGEFPFFKMVSSHIGRITYVTLFSQYLPAEVIQMQTNHHSLQMVEHYNKTELEEKQLQRAKVVAKAHSEINLKIV